MDIKAKKQLLREETARKLSDYSKEWVIKESSIIQKHVLESKEYGNADTIFCYVSFGKEVVTVPIIEDALKKGKTVGVPLCTGKGRMEARQIKSLDDLSPGAYGILEPKPETPIIVKEKIQYGIIPCVTCDLDGNRMGHGAGFYDRYLEGADWMKTIVCFDEILAEDVPVTPLDITMDQVITQTGMKKIRKNPA